MTARRAALVTGASTGIGLACAQRLDRLGWTVWAGVRRAEDAERVAALGSGRIVPLLLDVTVPAAIAAARDTIAAARGEAGLDALVNNAGIAIAGPLEYLPVEDFRRVQEVNVVSVVAVTQAFLPLIRRAAGRIINIGSISGRMTNPFIGAYAASKHAIEAVSDALRIELAPSGIRVALIEPGVITTPIWDKGRAHADALRAELPPEGEARYGAMMRAFGRIIDKATARGGSPELVADAVEHAILSPEPRTRYLVGGDARVRLFLRRVLPDRALDALILRVVRRAGEPG